MTFVEERQAVGTFTTILKIIISVLLDITEQSETGEEDTLAPVLILGPHLLVVRGHVAAYLHLETQVRRHLKY